MLALLLFPRQLENVASLCRFTGILGLFPTLDLVGADGMRWSEPRTGVSSVFLTDGCDISLLTTSQYVLGRLLLVTHNGAVCCTLVVLALLQFSEFCEPEEHGVSV